MSHFETTAYPTAAKHEKKTLTPMLHIVAHPDVSRIGARAPLFHLAHGNQQELSRGTPDFTYPGKALGKPLDDPFISRRPILLCPGPGGGIQIQLQNDRFHLRVDGARVTDTMLLSPEQIEKGVVLTLGERVVLLLNGASPVLTERVALPEIIGFSAEVQNLREEIVRVADLDMPVLLLGASGSGKELAAQAIHTLGDRKKPFVSVNMGAIPPNLAATELFGAVKGSFTGADRDQLGFFRAAQNGTLFLDEIGEASPEVQVMLLRALETGEITPVGAQRSIKVQTRLIAATDADLNAKIERDSFKVALLHRLSGYEIHLPPLKARREDFGVLFLHFARIELARIGESHVLKYSDPYAKPWLPTELVESMLAYDWPGNIRQLRNTVCRLVVGSRGKPCLEASHSITALFKQPEDEPPTAPKLPPRKPSGISDEELLETLMRNQWNIKATAEDLGIARGTLYGRIQKSDMLQKAGDLSEQELQSSMDKYNGCLEDVAADLCISVHALKMRLKEQGQDGRDG